MTTPPLLAVRDLRVRIGGRHILHGVDLDVAPSGVTALLGRNGAGKTTTVRGILGLVPRTGSVLLDGAETVRLATHTLVRRGIGYAPEDRGVFAGLTVAENLRLAERRDAGEPDYPLVHELFPELRARARPEPAWASQVWAFQPCGRRTSLPFFLALASNTPKNAPFAGNWPGYRARIIRESSVLASGHV